MKIIFMGTPDFAVPSLKLLAEKHEVVAVFTQRAKPVGRKQVITPSPIEQIASELKIQVFTPQSLRNENIISIIKSIEADIIVVVAYGFIVPKEILSSKKYGCINLHPSDLPKYRGPSPIQYTILSGEKEIGICIMQMDEGVDTGDVLMKRKLQIEGLNFEEVSDKCKVLGAEMILEVIESIDLITPEKQIGNYSNTLKIQKDDGKTSWDEDAEQIERKVRALNPWPGVFIENVKILEAKCIYQDHNFAPGFLIDKKNLLVACKKNILQIERLQKIGGKALSAQEFSRGNTLC